MTDLSIPAQIIGGHTRKINIDGQTYIVNLNDHAGYDGALYPVTELQRCIEMFDGAAVYDGHYDYSRKDPLGHIAGPSWCPALSAVIGWVCPTDSLAQAMLTGYREGTLGEVSGTYTIDFKPYQIGSKRFKRVTELLQVQTVDLVDQGTAGGRVLRLSEAKKYFREPAAVRVRDTFAAQFTPSIRG